MLSTNIVSRPGWHDVVLLLDPQSACKLLLLRDLREQVELETVAQTIVRLWLTQSGQFVIQFVEEAERRFRLDGA